MLLLQHSFVNYKNVTFTPRTYPYNTTKNQFRSMLSVSPVTREFDDEDISMYEKSKKLPDGTIKQFLNEINKKD